MFILGYITPASHVYALKRLGGLERVRKFSVYLYPPFVARSCYVHARYKR